MSNGAGSGDVTININIPPGGGVGSSPDEATRCKRSIFRRATTYVIGNNQRQNIAKKVSPVLASPQDPLGRSKYRESLQIQLAAKKQKLPFTQKELADLEKSNAPNRKNSRQLQICDLDFSDLLIVDETSNNNDGNCSSTPPAPLGLGLIPGPPPPPPPMGSIGIPPPPPLICFIGIPPPPPPMESIGIPPPPPPMGLMAPPPPPPLMLTSGIPPPPPLMGGVPPPIISSNGAPPPPPPNGVIKKSTIEPIKAKTIKLHWSDVRPFVKKSQSTIWDELPDAEPDIPDIQRFFSKKSIQKDKKSVEPKLMNLQVLDSRRALTINILRSSLPPMLIVAEAILQMDDNAFGRDTIEKIFGQLPTEDELSAIRIAKESNKGCTLGDAEQFLLDLAAIKDLPARLHLWLFKMDFANREKEIANSLMDLKQGITEIQESVTFREILSTIRAIGMCLNGSKVMGFRIEYLSKIADVKDTVTQKSLLHHLCRNVRILFEDSTDLASEMPATIRASRSNYVDVAHHIYQLEIECKLAHVRMKKIFKHETKSSETKVKTKIFLQESFERIEMLEIILQRIIERYRDMLSWLGEPPNTIINSLPHETCSMIAEFAIQYSREYIQQGIGEHKQKPRYRRASSQPDQIITTSVPPRSSGSRRPSLIQTLANLLTNSESYDVRSPTKGKRNSFNRQSSK